jgi:hypothetical protein
MQYIRTNRGRRASAHSTPVETLENRRLLAAGDYLSSAVIAGPGDERVADVLYDSSGGRTVIGTFTGTCDFAPGKTHQWLMTSRGGDDVFVARYSSTGRLVWARQLGGAGNDEAGGLAFSGVVDNTAHDNVVITGAFTGTADFNPTAGADLRTSAGKADIFVWSLSAAGKLNWARTVGGAGYDVANDLVVADGRIYIGGSFRETVNFRTGKTPHVFTSRGDRDAFIWRLYADTGLNQGLKQLGGEGDDAVTAMTYTLAHGNQVFAAGHFSGTANFGYMEDPPSEWPVSGDDVITTSVGPDDAFLIGYPPGSVMIMESFEQIPLDRTARVADVVASGPNVHVALNVGAPGTRDAVVWNARDHINPGTAAITIDGTGDTTIAALATDFYSNLWIAGTFTGSALGRTSAGGTDALFAKYDVNEHTLLAAASFGGADDDAGLTLGYLNSPATPTLAGVFRGTIDLDPTAGTQLRTSAGGDDAFMVDVVA